MSRPRIAAIVTEYRRYSHAQHILDRYLFGYGWNGAHHIPPIDLVSLYTDQQPEGELSRSRSESCPQMKIFPTIAEALTLGGEELAVDGVLLIGEHGNYPRNDKGQRLYPRYEFFQEIVSVFRDSGRSVPVFNDKHLSWNWEWAKEIWLEEAWEGIWKTVVLTQIVLVGTGLFSLFGFPLACRHFSGKVTNRIWHYLLIVVRTTPEYILAYIFLTLWGPSMLPAVWAILLHNGAILAFLSSNNADLVQLRMDAPLKRINRYFYEILPRIYGQFLAFLFYRWEVMMRESAILGILGIYTLGFYIHSAISDDQIDKAILLILFTAILNMGIDFVSQMVRRRLKISTKLSISS